VQECACAIPPLKKTILPPRILGVSALAVPDNVSTFPAVFGPIRADLPSVAGDLSKFPYRSSCLVSAVELVANLPAGRLEIQPLRFDAILSCGV
jgi:hypothetical protein